MSTYDAGCELGCFLGSREKLEARVMVSCSNMHEQFGHGYASVKKFKQNFLPAFR